MRVQDKNEGIQTSPAGLEISPGSVGRDLPIFVRGGGPVEMTTACQHPGSIYMYSKTCAVWNLPDFVESMWFPCSHLRVKDLPPLYVWFLVVLASSLVLYVDHKGFSPIPSNDEPSKVSLE